STAMQQHSTTSATNTTSTPNTMITLAAFTQQKTRIDSMVLTMDTIQLLEHAAFSGRARIGKYRVECNYLKPAKQILKANYLFVTDSLNFSKVYYFHENVLIKVNDNNTANYYQVGEHLFNEQGSIISPA